MKTATQQTTNSQSTKLWTAAADPVKPISTPPSDKKGETPAPEAPKQQTK